MEFVSHLARGSFCIAQLSFGRDQGNDRSSLVFCLVDRGALTAGWILIAVIFAANVHRACTQSITHDEAFTYHAYVVGPLDDVFDGYTANHHLLHSYLCRIVVTLCGSSELSLRAVSLAGGAIYLVMSLLICRMALGRGVVFLLGLAALTLNPFLLDYMSVARGYGLAAAFMMTAIYFLLRFWTAPPAERKLQQLTWASVCCALSVAANLTFVFGCFSLIVVTAVLLVAERSEWPSWRQLLDAVHHRQLIRPGLILWCLLSIPLVKARASHFYVGEGSFWDSLQGLVRASLAHHHLVWPLDTRSAGFEAALQAAVVAVLLAVAVIAVLASAAWWRAVGKQDPPAAGGRKTWRVDGQRLSQAQQALLLVGTTLLGTLAIVLALNATLDVNFPEERTGVYLVVLFTLAVMVVTRCMVEFG